jgi:DNA-binding protein HU-beta
MMNKTELVKAVSDKANLKVSETEKLVNAFIDTVSATLKKKQKVTLVGFGTFAVVHRKTKIGINPKTQAKITIKAKDVPVFRAGKALKDRIK